MPAIGWMFYRAGESSRARKDANESRMKKLSHYDKKGRVQMVDVTAKPPTARTAMPMLLCECSVQPWRACGAEIAERQSSRNCADRRNHGREAHVRADSSLSPHRR